MSEEPSPGDSSHPRAAVVVFVLVLVGSLAMLIWLFASFFTDAVLGFMFAGLSRPLYLRLVARGARPWISASVVTSLVALAIALPTTYLVTSLTQQAARAYQLASQSMTTDVINDTLFGNNFWANHLRGAFETLGLHYSADALRAALRDVARAVATLLSGEVNALLSNAFGAVYHFILLLVITYYGLIDGPRLKQRVFDLSPLPDDEEQLIIDKFSDVGRAILFGNGIGSVAQGFLGGLSMWMFGLGSSVFWGTVMALFAFLPLVGVSVVVIPVGLFLGVSGRWGAAIAFVSLNMLQALIIENVVKTKLIGDRMHMHNGLVFFALLGGLGAFGLVGILYGPLVVTLFMTTYSLYERVYKQRLLMR